MSSKPYIMFTNPVWYLNKINMWELTSPQSKNIMESSVGTLKCTCCHKMLLCRTIIRPNDSQLMDPHTCVDVRRTHQLTCAVSMALWFQLCTSHLNFGPRIQLISKWFSDEVTTRFPGWMSSNGDRCSWHVNP